MDISTRAARRRARRLALGAVLATGALATSASAALAAPTTTVTPHANLDPDATTTVTVRGSDFTAANGISPLGIYVAQTAIVDGQVVANAARARWVQSRGPTSNETLNPDGTFETTVEVSRTLTVGDTTVDCRVTPCAISTWRAHSLPTVDALYTSTLITFGPEAPTIEKPKIGRVSAAQRIGRSRTATVAILTCGSARCQISVPKAVRVKIGRARYRVRVLAPKTARAGQRVRVRVQLTKAAARALKHRRAKVRVRVAITANGTRTAKTVTATITGVRKAAKR